VAQLFGGLWLPLEEIDNLDDGQVLDRDSVTGAAVAVSRGRGTITLTESAADYTNALTYNEDNGMLLAMRQETRNGAGTIVVEVKLSSRR
jgi:hypothetical protein